MFEEAVASPLSCISHQDMGQAIVDMLAFYTALKMEEANSRIPLFTDSGSSS